MSKFEEMCVASNSSRKQWAEYRERSYGNLSKLIQGFVSYCEIPPKCFAFHPLDKEPEAGSGYTLLGATHFAHGFWNVGFEITLTNSLHSFPRPVFLIELSLREKDGKVFVKRHPKDKPRVLDINDESQCKEFYESIVDEVKKTYAKLQPDSDNAPASIGFASESGSPE